jgi:hypothetical protein
MQSHKKRSAAFLLVPSRADAHVLEAILCRDGQREPEPASIELSGPGRGVIPDESARRMGIRTRKASLMGEVL